MLLCKQECLVKRIIYLLAIIPYLPSENAFPRSDIILRPQMGITYSVHTFQQNWVPKEHLVPRLISSINWLCKRGQGPKLKAN
jgi:hypothetical protein